MYLNILYINVGLWWRYGGGAVEVVLWFGGVLMVSTLTIILLIVLLFITISVILHSLKLTCVFKLNKLETKISSHHPYGSTSPCLFALY